MTDAQKNSPEFPLRPKIHMVARPASALDDANRRVLGRKDWMFVGSDDGARVNTVFVSLLASARLHELEPLAHMRDLLCLLPSWPSHRVLELAPAYWKKTRENAETQEKLAANVFRRVLLESNV